VDLIGVRAIGVDEVHWQHCPHFLALVYQIDAARKLSLWISWHWRKTLLRLFRRFGRSRAKSQVRNRSPV
jgi:hypothetical protein